MPQPAMNTVADLIIVGGGPAGAVAAITAAKAGLRVVLVERKQEPTWKIGETLAPRAMPILERLGVLRALTACDHLDSPGHCSAWGRSRLAMTDFISNPYGGGWQLDRVAFERVLQNEAEIAGAEVLRGVKVVHCSWRDRTWDVTLSHGELAGKWIIDATGRAASVACRTGTDWLSLDRLIAVYMVHQPLQGVDRDARTLTESVRDGWWYSALIPGERRLTAFLTDADFLKTEDWRNIHWFIDKVAQTTHISAIHERHSYLGIDRPRATSAQSGRLVTSRGRQWLAVGDAAQTHDPLSGQGLFNALSTGYVAAKVIHEHLNGSSTAVQKYERLIETSWKNFVVKRRAFYRVEQRWADREFWHRRHSF